MTDPFDSRKVRAAEWFHALRDQIVAAFEALEDAELATAMADEFGTGAGSASTSSSGARLTP